MRYVFHANEDTLHAKALLQICCVERKLILTADGSHTVQLAGTDVTYHSRHGAVQESMHVFIEAGLRYVMSKHEAPIYILEMGFGTGLNALLTAMEAFKTRTTIHYTGLEKYPLAAEQWQALNYGHMLHQPDIFAHLHEAGWNKDVRIHTSFILNKAKEDMLSFHPVNPSTYQLVYYDAFAPSAQPELWTKEIFEKLFSIMDEDGTLVTYCSKGDVRRAMMAAGFKIEKIAGPAGKREMVRALKQLN